MHKFTLLAFAIALAVSKLTAQECQLSLSGTYGVVKTDYLNYYNTDQKFKAIGTALGFELKVGKRFTVGGDVDWQRFESELALAVPLTSPNLPDLFYSIDRHQFNIRPTFRYYFRKAFRGLYVGVFGTYSYLTVKTSDYPQESDYFPALYTDPSDDFGLGGGLTYGYRFKLNSALQVSAFGSHQLFWNDVPEFQQQDHQFGLGLNWTL